MYTYKGQTTLSTRQLSFTGVGENLVDEKMTAADALQRGGLLGWDVRKVAIQTVLDPANGADSHLVVPEKFASVATIHGTPRALGVVGSRYAYFQNEQTVELLDTIVDEGGANFVAVGTLANYRKMFAVMQMPEGLNFGGQDAAGLYLGLTNAHDGTGSLVAWVTAVQLACTNQITSSIRGAKAKWRIRHTGSLAGKVQDARESLELTSVWAEEISLTADRLIGTKMSGKQFDKMLDALEPASDSKAAGWVARQDEKRATLRFLFNDAETNLARGTRWGAYNAFTEYHDWYLPIKGQDADGSKRANRILDSTSLDADKQQALDYLLAA